MAERKQVDWESVERDYSAGLLSLREIAAKYGVSQNLAWGVAVWIGYIGVDAISRTLKSVLAGVSDLQILGHLAFACSIILLVAAVCWVFK